MSRRGSQDPPGYVYLDGRIVASRTARISPFDRGFLYADGLLETVRVYGRRPFALERHIERLHASAAFLAIPVPAVEWEAAIGEVLRCNRLRDAWVRITLTRGLSARGLELPKEPMPTILIAAGKIDPAIATRQRRGVHLVTVPFCRDPFLAAYKTLDFLPGILAKAAATGAGADDALFTDARARVLETTTANIFLWKGKELRTPGRGALPGVTRKLVIDTARETGARVHECSIMLRDLAAADEAFITSSLIEIVPVVEINGNRIGKGRAGARTRQLQRAYLQLTRG